MVIRNYALPQLGIICALDLDMDDQTVQEALVEQLSAKGKKSVAGALAIEEIVRNGDVASVYLSTDIAGVGGILELHATDETPKADGLTPYTILFRRYGQIEIRASSAAEARRKFETLGDAELNEALGTDGDDYEITEVMEDEPSDPVGGGCEAVDPNGGERCLKDAGHANTPGDTIHVSPHANWDQNDG